MFWQAIGLTAATATLAAVFLHHRGKAKIGDTVKFNYRPGVVTAIPGLMDANLGTQALQLTGRVVDKRDPLYGPFYNIQLFATPKGLGPEVEMLIKSLPSTIESVSDKDIIENFGMLAAPVVK